MPNTNNESFEGQNKNPEIQDTSAELKNLRDSIEKAKELEKTFLGLYGLQVKFEIDKDRKANMTYQGIVYSVDFDEDYQEIPRLAVDNMKVDISSFSFETSLKSIHAFVLLRRGPAKLGLDLKVIKQCTCQKDGSLEFAITTEGKEIQYIVTGTTIARVNRQFSFSNEEWKEYQDLDANKDRTINEQKRYEKLRKSATRELTELPSGRRALEERLNSQQLIRRFVDTIGTDGISLVSETLTWSSGRLTERKSKEGTDLLDEKGGVLLRRKEGKFLFQDTKGEFFDPYSISAEEFIRRITTPEAFHRYEETRSMVPKCRDEAVKFEYGLRVCGVRSRMDKISKIFGGTNVAVGSLKGILGKPSIQLLESKLPEVIDALGHYPPEMLQRLDIRRISLMDNDAESEKLRGVGIAGGTANSNTMELKIALYGQGFVGDPATIMHHELLHFVDYKYLSRFSEGSGISLNWSEWSENEIEKVRFAEQKFGDGEGTPKYEKNYANGYGMTNDFEDAASMGELLLSQKNGIALRKRALENPILERKIRLIERAYYALSNGKMDAQFWTDIAEGKKVDTKYWKDRGEDFIKDEEGEKLRGSFETWDILLVKEKELKAASAPKIEFAREYAKAIQKHPHREIYRKLHDTCLYLPNEEAIPIMESVINESAPYWIYSYLSSLYNEKKDFVSAITVWERMMKFIPSMRKDAERSLKRIEEQMK